MQIRFRTVLLICVFTFSLMHGNQAFTRCRFLNPAIGRFMSADPQGQPGLLTERLAGNMPINGGQFLPRDAFADVAIANTPSIQFIPTSQYHDGMSLYALEGNNSLIHTDPTGLCKICDLIYKCKTRCYENLMSGNSGVLNKALESAYDDWKKCNDEVGAKDIADAVNAALKKLGLGGTAISEPEKAGLSPSDGAALWSNPLFSGSLTISSSGSESANLGGGWALKLYQDGGTYHIAVLPQNASYDHVSDALSWSSGNHTVNGEEAEAWLGKAGYTDAWNEDKLNGCPDLKKNWEGK